MTKLNILICPTINTVGSEGQPVIGNAVYVRNGYTPIDQGARFVEGTEQWDANAINNLGDLGAFGVVSDGAGVAAAVAAIRAEFGVGLPVQDNSGRFPNLATVTGVGQF